MIRLDSRSGVQAAFGLNVGVMRLLGCVERSEVVVDATNIYARRPSLVVPLDAHQSGTIVNTRPTDVLNVSSLSAISQIGKSVVGSITVDVVKHATRPRFECVQPGQSVSLVREVVEADYSVATSIEGASHIAAISTSSPSGPSEDSRLRVVVKKLAQTLRGNIRLSHDALQMLIGQKPAFDSQSMRASLFSGRVA